MIPPITHATIYVKDDGGLHFTGQTTQSMFGTSERYKIQGLISPRGFKLVGWIKLGADEKLGTR